MSESSRRERARLDAIADSGLHRGLGPTEDDPEGMLDDVAAIAAQLMGAAAAVVSVIDGDVQWYLGRHGTDSLSIPREQAICDLAIDDPSRPLVIPDTRLDPRVAHLPLVGDDPVVRSYAGMPIRLPEGDVVGTVCAFDARPSTPTPGQVHGLACLARVVERELASLARAHRLEQRGQQAAERADREHQFLQAVLHNLDDAIIACDPQGRLTVFNPASWRIHGLDRQGPTGELASPDTWRTQYEFLAEDGVTPLPSEDAPLVRALRGERVRGQEIVVKPKGMPARRLRCSGQQLRDEAGELLGAVIAMADITEAWAARERLEYLATHDQLTGLLSRGQVEAVVRDLLAGADPGHQVVVAYVDLNQFKEINDLLGHPVGDHVLATVADRLQQATPADAVLARMGGDEFLAIWITAEDADPAEVADGLAWHLDGPVAVVDHDLDVTSAVGVVLQPVTPIPELRRWIHEADQAMYEDKRGDGRRADDHPPGQG